MRYRRIHRLLAARKHAGEADALADWQGPELRSLGWLLTRRVLRGALLRPRLKRAAGLVFCERNVHVHHARYVEAGRDLNLEEGCQIIGLSRRGIVFGDRCTVGRYATISPTNLLGGEPGEGLKLGDNANIGPYAFVGCSGYISIGDRVLMGPRVNLLAENHRFADLGRPIKLQGVERSFITIEDDCWIGAGSTILAGVTVAHDSVVAAGSVVTKDVPPLSIVGGVPAEVIRTREAAPRDGADRPAAAGHGPA
jgi:acetyltransferase-like isoleucine patch superfamily enzyme